MNIGTPLTKINFDVYKDLPRSITTMLPDDSDAEDIEIITLKQYMWDQAAEDAWRRTNDFYKIDEIADNLITTKYHTAKEFVFYDGSKFTVGVNAEHVDQTSIDHAFALLSSIKQPILTIEWIEFGNDIQVYEPAI